MLADSVVMMKMIADGFGESIGLARLRKAKVVVRMPWRYGHLMVAL